MNFANSQLVSPNNAQIKLYNNPANIVEHKFLPEGVVDYTYDTEYNLTNISNSSSTVNFTYDPISRLTQAQTAGTIQPATSISYVYDLNSNLTSMTDPAGVITNHVYDTLNRLTDIKDPSDQVISHYDYDDLSRRTQKQFTVGGQQFAANYQYDIASQLLAITNLPTTISNAYTYDNVGNRLSLTDNNGLHNYSYDNVYRLINSSNPSETYNYDPVGNRNPLINNYNGGNRLLDDNTYTYNYDLNGNMTQKVKKIGGETTTYTYNSEDQLIGVNGNITYKYDVLGRRIEKNVGGTITRYIYDGEDIIQEYDGNNALVATYTHGPGIDEPILVEKNGQKYYYIADGLGSITALIDQNGNIAQTYRYDSFGNILSSTGSLNQPYTYTGREYDAETGLYYYRARYYDPKSGRFLQEDPFKGFVRLPLTQNHYTYVINNPLNLTDPHGLIIPQLIGGIIGAGIGAYVAYINCGDIWQSALVGFGTGVLSTLPIPGINPLLSGVIMGAVAGATGNLISQLNGNSINPTSFYLSTASGAIGGAAGGLVGGVVNGSLTPVFSPSMQPLVNSTVSGAVAGATDAFSQSYYGIYEKR